MFISVQFISINDISIGRLDITVRELCELRDHVNTCDIVSANMIHVLLGELCIE